MTNLDIAYRLLAEAKAGRLDPAVVARFGESLQYGGPVDDPKSWLDRSARSLFDLGLLSGAQRDQVLGVSGRWEEIAKTQSEGKAT